VYLGYCSFIAACRPAAELASFWNKPIVTWVATDPEFNDKSVYTTLGRTLGPFSKMGTFLVEVLNQYKWRKVAVVWSTYFVWLEAGTAIRKVYVYCLLMFFSISFRDICSCTVFTYCVVWY